MLFTLTLCVTVLFQCGQASASFKRDGLTVMTRLNNKEGEFVGYLTGKIRSWDESGGTTTFQVQITEAPKCDVKNIVGKFIPVKSQDLLPENYLQDLQCYFTGKKEGRSHGPKKRWFYIAQHIKTIYYFNPTKKNINDITNIRMMASPGNHTKAYKGKWYDWADVEETKTGILLKQCKQETKDTRDREILIDDPDIKARVLEMLRNIDNHNESEEIMFVTADVWWYRNYVTGTTYEAEAQFELQQLNDLYRDSILKDTTEVWHSEQTNGKYVPLNTVEKLCQMLQLPVTVTEQEDEKVNGLGLAHVNVVPQKEIARGTGTTVISQQNPNEMQLNETIKLRVWGVSPKHKVKLYLRDLTLDYNTKMTWVNGVRKTVEYLTMTYGKFNCEVTTIKMFEHTNTHYTEAINATSPSASQLAKMENILYVVDFEIDSKQGKMCFFLDKENSMNGNLFAARQDDAFKYPAYNGYLLKMIPEQFITLQDEEEVYVETIQCQEKALQQEGWYCDALGSDAHTIEEILEKENISRVNENTKFWRREWTKRVQVLENGQWIDYACTEEEQKEIDLLEQSFRLASDNKRLLKDLPELKKALGFSTCRRLIAERLNRAQGRLH